MRDRSQAQVGGGAAGDTGPHGSGLPPTGAAPGGGNDMASALAAALSARNKKVSHSGKLFFPLHLRGFVLTRLQMTRVMMTSGTKPSGLSAMQRKHIEQKIANLRRWP